MTLDQVQGHTFQLFAQWCLNFLLKNLYIFIYFQACRKGFLYILKPPPLNVNILPTVRTIMKTKASMLA